MTILFNNLTGTYMHKSLNFLVATIFFALSAPELLAASFQKPVELGDHVFKSIKLNQFKLYDSRFINKSDIEYFNAKKLTFFKKNSSKSEVHKIRQTQQSNILKFPLRRSTNLLAAKKSFEKARVAASKAGVKWESAKFKGVQLENQRRKYGIESADLFVTFTNGKIHYVIKIKNCLKLKRGWILSGKLHWDGKGK